MNHKESNNLSNTIVNNEVYEKIDDSEAYVEFSEEIDDSEAYAESHEELDAKLDAIVSLYKSKTMLEDMPSESYITKKPVTLDINILKEDVLRVKTIDGKKCLTSIPFFSYLGGSQNWMCTILPDGSKKQWEPTYIDNYPDDCYYVVPELSITDIVEIASLEKNGSLERVYCVITGITENEIFYKKEDTLDKARITSCIEARKRGLADPAKKSVIKNEPKVEETPKVEEPPKVEETPKVEEPPKVEEIKVEETPKVEEIKVEETKVEETKVEEASKVEETKVEELDIEQMRKLLDLSTAKNLRKLIELEINPEIKAQLEEIKNRQMAEEAKRKESKAKRSRTKKIKVEELKTEEPKVEVSKTEEPKVEVSKTEEPKVEVSKTEELKTEEPKVEVKVPPIKAKRGRIYKLKMEIEKANKKTKKELAAIFNVSISTINRLKLKSIGKAGRNNLYSLKEAKRKFEKRQIMKKKAAKKREYLAQKAKRNKDKLLEKTLKLKISAIIERSNRRIEEIRLKKMERIAELKQRLTEIKIHRNSLKRETLKRARNGDDVCCTS